MTANDVKSVEQIKKQYRIYGNSPALDAALWRALRVAKSDVSVVVYGESGSGKDVLSRIIHDNSSRKASKKYCAVNCGALPPGTIDSELFGHVKGAFTDAVKERKGFFGEYDGGTIFLDEVAEMPLDTQARLLRVLENGEYIRVGDSVPMKTNVRIVAATNKDLLQAVGEGRFRADLYYRLATVTITVPPLRERGDDVVLLAKLFLREFAEREGARRLLLTPDAEQCLKQYSWPGNVRELRNKMREVATLVDADSIDGATLQTFMPAERKAHLPAVVDSDFDSKKQIQALFIALAGLKQEIDEIKQSLAGTASISVNSNVADLERPMRSLPKGIYGFAPHDAHAAGSAPQYDDSRLGGNHHYADDSFATIVHRPQVELPGSQRAIDEVTATEVQPLRGSVPGRSLDDMEREAIIETLGRNHGRRKATAQELKISERTLYRKIKEYGLDRK